MVGSIGNTSQYSEALGKFGAEVRQLPEVKDKITSAFTTYLSAVRNGKPEVLEIAKAQMEQVLQSHKAPETALMALNEWDEHGKELASRYAANAYAPAIKPKTEEPAQEVAAAPEKKGFFSKWFGSKTESVQENPKVEEQQPRNSRTQEYVSNSLTPPVVNAGMDKGQSLSV